MRPTSLVINLDALRHNVIQVKSSIGSAQLMAVVKANAYGHGLIESAKILEKSGADYFGVALVEEGIALRQSGITKPILVFGAVFPEQIGLFLQHNLEITAASVDKLKAINQVAQSASKQAIVHLKIDTGMERVGIHDYSSPKFALALKECPNCIIKGVYSHFARSEEKDLSFTRVQLERFQKCLLYFKEAGIEIPIKHIANSGGLLQLPEAHLDLVRCGICLYGLAPTRELSRKLDLRPVMSLHSKVAYFKVVQPGATVSYGGTWQAKKQTRVVTVPLGYGDGYSRRLSNHGSVLIRGERYPIIGNVCMDQMMVDIGEGTAYNGDEVVLIGKQGEQEISIFDIAEQIGTDPRDVMVSANERIPRVYLGGL